MINIKICKNDLQEGKYGLLITGEVFSGREPYGEYDYDSGRTYYAPIYKTMEELVLKPEFDKIENVTFPGVGPGFFKACQYGKFGFYYLCSYNAKYKIIKSQDKKSGLHHVDILGYLGHHIEYENINFSSRYEYSSGQEFKKAIGGFILQPHHNTLEIEPIKEQSSFHITVGAKHGLLSQRGYWGEKPIYDDIKKVSKDIFIFKLNNKYKVMKIKGYFELHPGKNTNSIIVITGKWNKVKQSILSFANCNDELEKIEREWLIKAKKRWWLFEI